MRCDINSSPSGGHSGGTPRVVSSRVGAHGWGDKHEATGLGTSGSGLRVEALADERKHTNMSMQLMSINFSSSTSVLCKPTVQLLKQLQLSQSQSLQAKTISSDQLQSATKSNFNSSRDSSRQLKSQQLASTQVTITQVNQDNQSSIVTSKPKTTRGKSPPVGREQTRQEMALEMPRVIVLSMQGLITWTYYWENQRITRERHALPRR